MNDSYFGLRRPHDNGRRRLQHRRSFFCFQEAQGAQELRDQKIIVSGSSRTMVTVVALLENHPRWRLSHVLREGNQSPDYLAKRARESTGVGMTCILSLCVCKVSEEYLLIVVTSLRVFLRRFSLSALFV
ncbi:hypothetical protein QQ045_010468 [Rhodiola kirilowii]